MHIYIYIYEIHGSEKKPPTELCHAEYFRCSLRPKILYFLMGNYYITQNFTFSQYHTMTYNVSMLFFTISTKYRCRFTESPTYFVVYYNITYKLYILLLYHLFCYSSACHVTAPLTILYSILYITPP